MKFKYLTSAKKDKKLEKQRKHGQWWFEFWIGRKIWKIISDFLYMYRKHTNTNTYQIFMVPDDFKKYSNEEIERALDIFKHNGILYWEHKTIKNEDGYLLIISSQNRSHARFSNRFLEEINLNDVKVEPITQNEQTKQQITHPEQSIQDEELPAEKMIDAKQPVHAEQPKQVESTPAKRKSVWDD